MLIAVMAGSAALVVAVALGLATAEPAVPADRWHAQLLPLMRAVPGADPNAWAVVSHTYTEAESKRFAAALRLKRSDVAPAREFFVAYDSSGRFVGVVSVVSVVLTDHPNEAATSDTRADGKPSAEPGANTAALTVAVAPNGRIASVTLESKPATASSDLAPLLDQLKGRSLGCTFAFNKKGLTVIKGAGGQSKRVARAAHAALVAMQIALGNPDAEPPPCTQ